jgi:VanZ family protein
VKWARTIFWNYLILILIITVFPFNFNFAQIPEKFVHGWEFFLTGLSPRRYTLVFDLLMNIVVFIPLGALWRAGFGRQESRWYHPAAIGFWVSLAIELSQFCLPYRFPSLTDLFTNTAGALVGGLISQDFTLSAISIFFRNYFAEKLSAKRQKMWRWWLAVYMLMAFLLVVGWMNQINLNNWEEHFPLQIGNEATGEREWHGTIVEISLWDSALKNESEKAASAPLWQMDFRNVDSTLLQKLPAEGWALFHPEKIGFGKDGMTLYGGWLQNSALGQKLSGYLRQRGRFTLQLTIAQPDAQNVGPARMVSLSPDNDRCNFMLGQHGATLCFRLRTPLSGSNGDNPIIWQTDFFRNDSLATITIVFDGNELNLLKNGRQTESRMRYAPEVAMLKNVFQIQASRFILFERLYYWILFYPLAILAAPAFRRKPLAYIWVLLAICGGYWFIIWEFSPESIGLSNVLLSLLALATAGAGFYRPLNHKEIS